MKNYWSYIKNDRFAIGCTGQTVYVYDADGNEIKKFKDIIYAYTAMFCPKDNIFVVKSTSGMLAAYSLEKMQLIKKFRFSKVDAAQDDGFCFSWDGEYFYNIERHIDSCKTALSIYDTSNFNLINQLFLDDYSLVLSHIEYDSERCSLFVLGFTRGDDDEPIRGFVAELHEDQLICPTTLEAGQFQFIRGYKCLELKGFTAKAKEWSSLKYSGYDLTDIESMKIRLSDYIEEN